MTNHDNQPKPTKHPGSYCSPPGATGQFATGREAICSAKTPGDRPRWRASGPPPAKTGRRPRKTTTAAGVVVPEQPILHIPPTPTAVHNTETAYKRAAEAPRLADVSDADLAAAVQHLPHVAPDDYNRERLVTEAARRMYPPDPAAAPVPYTMSTAPLAGNTWGDIEVDPDAATHHFHNDGVVGQAVRSLAGHGKVDVDGEPLANHLGRIATDVDLCTIPPQEGVQRMVQLRDRMPAGTHARQVLDRAVSQMACPDLPPPAIPDATPEPLRQLILDLHQIPMVRRDGKETRRLIDVVNRWQAGERDAVGMRFLTAVSSAAVNARHESNGDRGKRAIDHRVQAAIDELEALRQADQTVFYPPSTQ